MSEMAFVERTKWHMWVEPLEAGGSIPAHGTPAEWVCVLQTMKGAIWLYEWRWGSCSRRGLRDNGGNFR